VSLIIVQTLQSLYIEIRLVYAIMCGYVVAFISFQVGPGRALVWVLDLTDCHNVMTLCSSRSLMQSMTVLMVTVIQVHSW
jgi:hypothetical protein